jgi:hypothetical protein
MSDSNGKQWGGRRHGAGRPRNERMAAAIEQGAGEPGGSRATLYRTARRTERLQPEAMAFAADGSNARFVTNRAMDIAASFESAEAQIAALKLGIELRQARKQLTNALAVSNWQRLCGFDRATLLRNDARQAAAETIGAFHYTRSVPSGKSYFFRYEDALVVYSLPANFNIGRFLFGTQEDAPWRVWELARLWAPDGHRRDLLTEAISKATGQLRLYERDVDAVVSYADPNVGHSGHIYRAASWIEHGQSDENRGWRHVDGGPFVARRAFHSAGAHMNKADVEALGYVAVKLEGKHRFVRLLSHRAKRAFKRENGPVMAAGKAVGGRFTNGR